MDTLNKVGLGLSAIKRKVRVAHIVEKMVESRIWLFEHAWRRLVDNVEAQ